MTSGRSTSVHSAPICISPKHFADYLSPQQDYCLFLDIDGTLADFTLNPKDSFIPTTTLTLLEKIQSHSVNIAIVTGRSLAEARQMLSPIKLPIAATHGLEMAFDGISASLTQINFAELTAIKQAIRQSCTPYDDLLIEDKPYSIALHYRQNPALADVAYAIMSTTSKNHPDWLLKQGKYVWEIAPKAADKGVAILILLKQMHTNDTLCPIFIGDDITDEEGFIAVQDSKRSVEKSHLTKGMGIKVGNECQQLTCAHYYVNDIHEVTVLLEGFLDFCQKRSTLLPDLANMNVPINVPAVDKHTRQLI
ncbi:trehalose 6-phosphate phosphatase [Psychrobacter luti]|uniref:Trehalose 6-phosphate phosphatase n=1 Tax=Psychrobacter luti TaxID=198481 RepID=A0A839TBF7_9GAMM|nr:trehalose-phosphatase [Psychrobacter luti]MBB3105786.1 trehalose 6-phosphate phosphatase [Psychrobacter luti]